jgi:hypothetical protein
MDNTETIEMSVREFLNRLPCGLTIRYSPQDEWPAYYFYAMAAGEVTEMRTNFDMSYLTLDARAVITLTTDVSNYPKFEVRTGGEVGEVFEVHGNGLGGEDWHRMVTTETDWSFF